MLGQCSNQPSPQPGPGADFCPWITARLSTQLNPTSFRVTGGRDCVCGGPAVAHADLQLRGRSVPPGGGWSRAHRCAHSSLVTQTQPRFWDLLCQPSDTAIVPPVLHTAGQRELGPRPWPGVATLGSLLQQRGRSLVLDPVVSTRGVFPGRALSPPPPPPPCAVLSSGSCDRGQGSVGTPCCYGCGSSPSEGH